MKKTVISFLLLASGLALQICPVCARPAEYTLSDRSLFECEAFAEWICESVEGAQDGILTRSECVSVTEIDVSGRADIYSLSGAEIFENLLCINASGCSVSEFSAKEMPSLAFLDLSGCPITSLELPKESELYYLKLDNTPVSDIDLSGCKRLYYLSLSGCKAEKLDLSFCGGLFSLFARETPLRALTLPKSSPLTVLELANTSLQSIDLSSCGSLAYLDVSGSLLQKADLRGCDSLECVNISHTSIKEADLRNKKALTSLDASHSGLLELCIEGCIELSYVNIENTRISEFSHPEPSSLVTLIAGKTDIETLDLSEAKNLTCLFLLDSEIEKLLLCEEICGSANLFIPERLYAVNDKTPQDKTCESGMEEENSTNDREKPSLLCISNKRITLIEKYFFKKLFKKVLQNQ